MAVKSSMTEGAAIGQTELYNRLKSFLELDAGWTVMDDSDPEDVYFNSMGTGAIAYGRRTNIRLSLNEKGMIAPGWCQGKKGIFVRGSCDAAEIFPFGDFEAILKRYMSNVSTQHPECYYLLPAHPGGEWRTPAGISGRFAQTAPLSACWPGHTNGKLGIQEATNVNVQGWQFAQEDLPPNVVISFPAATSTSYFGCLASTDGVWYHYRLSTSGVLYRLNIHTELFDTLASAPWGAADIAYGSSRWDGDDLIYVARGDNTTDFASYRISTNTWTSLTALPQARSTTNGVANVMVYIPTEVSGLSNRIYWHINANNTAHFYYYDIDANTWSAALDPPVVTSYNNQYIQWWYFGGTTILASTSSDATDRTQIFEYDIPTNVWSGPLHPHDTPTQFYRCTIPASFNQGCLQLPGAGDIDYWFSGDEDGVKVVTAHYLPDNQPIYQFVYFGRYTPDKNDARYFPTAIVSPGNDVAVTLDDASNVHIGEFWPLVDPSNGTYERVFVQNKVGSVVTLRTVVNSYTLGSFLSQDPYPFVITDGATCGMPLWPSGDKDVHGVAPWGMLVDTDFQERVFMSINDRDPAIKVAQPSIFSVENVDGGREVYGTIPGLCVLPMDVAYGNPSQINGEDYLVFQTEEGRLYRFTDMLFRFAVRLV